ncbi:hypothetical protein C8J57DRAFT_7072 [Mycena rebaudengoi]|nr:hypothetical protein C8J57DRAFT_7072 [Mycena rebaudengoi]
MCEQVCISSSAGGSGMNVDGHRIRPGCCASPSETPGVTVVLAPEPEEETDAADAVEMDEPSRECVGVSGGVCVGACGGRLLCLIVCVLALLINVLLLALAVIVLELELVVIVSSERRCEGGAAHSDGASQVLAGNSILLGEGAGAGSSSESSSSSDASSNSNSCGATRFTTGPAPTPGPVIPRRAIAFGLSPCGSGRCSPCHFSFSAFPLRSFPPSIHARIPFPAPSFFCASA